MVKCKICGQTSNLCFRALVLNKYNVEYFKCGNCQFIQTEEPYWLEEAYAHAITKEDVGLVNRNIYIYPILSLLIKTYFEAKAKFVDYGGGYGLLTRIMRDIGFNFHRFDIYCENIFAKNFDINLPFTKSYELVTAFEVFEHLTDPVSELEKLLELSDNIFFSTEITNRTIQSPADWWYVMPETGQHIALYTEKSLGILAMKYGLKYYTNGFDLHLFTKKSINPFVFKLIANSRFARFADFLTSRKNSLLPQDYSQQKTGLTK